ncbi:MAG TPA: trehalose-phosphatase [Candidatus Methylomirabilis sp.]|nr:trehalose-phosphatase [Candidatus Methylomirabilis sp.]
MKTQPSSTSLARAWSQNDEPADPGALAQAVVEDARSLGGLLLFADYDGALCPDRRDGDSTRLPLLARGALVALAATPSTRVVVTSWRSACDLEDRVGVPGVVCAGRRGLEARDAGATLFLPAASQLRDSVVVLAEQLSENLAPLPGVQVEISEMGVRIHVRGADPSAVPVTIAQAEELRRTAVGEFRMWPSEGAIDLFPDADWRDACLVWMQERWRRDHHASPAVVYLGRDDTDEEAYRALRGHGHAVHVGRPPARSAASSWVVDRAAALELLAGIAFSWSGDSPDC